MWLPKEERLWLNYFLKNATYDTEGEIEYIHLPKKETELPEAKKISNLLSVKETKIKLLAALNRLIERKLLVTDDHNSVNPEIINYFFGQQYKLTLMGWDLANKYNHRIRRIGLWFNEYRDCGAGFVFGLLGGLITSVVLRIIQK